MNLPSLGPGWNAVRPQLLLIGLLAIVNLIVAVAFTGPAWSEAAASGIAVRRGQQAQETLGPTLERARRVYGRVMDAEEGVEMLQARVIARSGTVSDVVTTLRAAIDAAGLTVERVNYSTQPVDGLGLVQVQVELPVRGRYEDLRRFLDELLGGPIFAVVERVGAATQTRDDTGGPLNMAVTFSAFASPWAEGRRPMDEDAAESLPPVSGDPVSVARNLSDRLRALPPIPLQPEELELDLGRLERPMPEGGASTRNLFAFAGEVLRRQREAELAAEEPEEIEPEGPPRPVMPYSLLGITRTDDGLLATLAKDEEIFLMRRGDLLPDGLRVVRVEEELVVLEAGDRRTRLKLGKDQPNDPMKRDRESGTESGTDAGTYDGDTDR